jgi:molybdopterin synthase catalytic subunit
MRVRDNAAVIVGMSAHRTDTFVKMLYFFNPANEQSPQ